MSTFVKGGSGSEKVTVDGVKVKEKLELTSYSGDNPYTMGQEGMTFEANTLITDELNIINGVSGEDLTETAADQTTAVTELLKMVSRKVADHKGEGQYVWKKYSSNPNESIVSMNATQLNTGTSVNVTLSSDTDISNITADDLVGTTFGVDDGGNGVVTLTTSTNFTYITGMNDYSGTYTYDSNTQTLAFVCNGSFDSIYVWTVKTSTVTVAGIFIDFVVSSDESAYPDGDYHTDSYWYELVKEGVRGIEYGEFVVAAATSKVTLEHSLNEVPTIAFFLPKNSTVVDASNTKFGLYNPSYSGGFYMYNGVYYVNAGFTVTETTLVLNFDYAIPTDAYVWAAIVL